MSLASASKRLRSSFSISGLSKSYVARQQYVSVSLFYAWINPNNERFPDAFQLDRLCRTLDTDCAYILTGEYENLVHRYLATLDAEGVANAKGMVSAVVNTILRCKGAPPVPKYYEEEQDPAQVQRQARTRLIDIVEQRYANDGAKVIADVVQQPIRKVKRWLSPTKPEGFPDAFTLMKICEHLHVGFGDIVRNRPAGQDFEFYLSNLNANEMDLAKNLAATLLSSVYRL